MSFLNALTQADRERLRDIVRRTHMKYYAKEMITPYEIDKLIDAIGPEVAAQLIQRAAAVQSVGEKVKTGKIILPNA